MTAKRIELCLCPDYVRSPVDGDRHFIDAHTLCHLYGVKYDLCDVQETPMTPLKKPEGTTVIFLRPRYKGDYVEWLQKTLHEQFGKL